MVVADVSDPVETSQSTDRDAEQRVGLGLLLALHRSRLSRPARRAPAARSGTGSGEPTSSIAGCTIGGTDRGILSSARNDVLLDRVAELVASDPNPGDSLRVARRRSAHCSRARRGARRVWVTNADGHRIVDRGHSEDAARLIDSVDRVRVSRSHGDQLRPIRRAGDAGRRRRDRSICQHRLPQTVGGAPASPQRLAVGRVGVLVDTDSLRALLMRTSSTAERRSSCWPAPTRSRR